MAFDTSVLPQQGKSLFRQHADVHFGKRSYVLDREDEPGTSQAIIDQCSVLRDRLNSLVANQLDWLCEQVDAIQGIDVIDASLFWKFTVDNIYRKNLSRGPRIREFYPLDTEPYADAPSEPEIPPQPVRVLRSATIRQRQFNLDLKAHRRNSLRRCLHRLVNTRILRGAMAIVGLHDVDVNMVDDPQRNWDDHRLKEWQKAENNRMRFFMPFSADESAHDHSWWKSTNTGRLDNYTRSQCFPHRSQRGLWSREALRCVTIATELADADSTVVHLCARHIAEDVREAVINYQRHELE